MNTDWSGLEESTGFKKIRATFWRQADIGYIFSFFVASRLLLEAIGLLSRILIQPYLNYDYVWVYSNFVWLDIWGVWDTGWYLDIAGNGYDMVRKTSGPIAGQANWAFFPAYPMITAFISQLTGLSPFAAMIAVSNLCFLVALVILWRETADEFGRSAARATVALLCLTPGSYVFSSGYAESLFLLVVSATLALARRRRWVAAGLAAGIAALTRNTGIGLVLPIILLGGKQLVPLISGNGGRIPSDKRRSYTNEAWRIAASISIPMIALIGFGAFLYIRAGDPLAFVSIQDAWQRKIRSPTETLFLPLLDPQSLPAMDILNWIFAWLSVVMLVQLARWRRWSLLALGIFFVFVPLSAGLLSYVRYTIVMLPVVMAAGALCAERPVAMTLVLSTLAAINGFMMSAWALGFPFVI